MPLACESHAPPVVARAAAGDHRRLRGGASPQHPAADLWRPERGGVFLPLRPPADFPAPGSGLRVRSGIRHQRGRQRAASRVERRRAYHVRLLLRKRRQDFLLLDGALRRGLPPRPDYSQGYVWALYDYDIYVANADGQGARRNTNNPHYDAEGTLSPDGTTIVFTSLRNGDLDIYTMSVDGRHL